MEETKPKIQRQPRSPNKTNPLKRIAGRTLRFGRWLLLFCLLILAYLCIWGFPDAAVQKFLSLTKQNGVDLQIASMKIDIRQGLVAKDCVIRTTYIPGGTLEAREMCILLNPFTMLDKNFRGLSGFSIDSGNFTGTLDTKGEAPQSRDFEISDIDARMTFIPGVGLKVEEMKAETCGVKFAADGRMVLGEGWGLFNSNRKPMPPEMKAEHQGVRSRKIGLIIKTLDELEALKGAEDPLIDLQFDFHPNNPIASTLSVLAECPERSVIRNVPFERFEVRASLSNLVMRVDTFVAEKEKTKLEGTARYNLKEDLLTVNVVSSLALGDLKAFMPRSLVAELDERGLELDGQWTIAFKVDEVPLVKAGRNFSGTIDVKKGAYLGVWFEEGKAAFAFQQGRLRIHDIDATVGKGVAQGPLSGEVDLDYVGKSFHGEFDARCYPGEIKNLFSEKSVTYQVIEMIKPQGAPPHVWIRFDGDAGIADSTRIEARMKGTNVHYQLVSELEDPTRGAVDFKEVALSVALEGRELRLKNVEAVLGEGPLEGPLAGNFVINFTNHTYQGTFDSLCDLHEIKPLFGQDSTINEVINRLEVTHAPPRVNLEFFVDHDEPEALRIKGHIAGTNVVYQSTPLSSISADLSVSNQLFRIDRLLAEREEGLLEGWFAIDFEEELLQLDAISSFQPGMLAQMIDPKIKGALKGLIFKGQGMVQAAGQIDFGSNKRHNVTGTMFFEDAGTEEAFFEDCYFYWIGRNNVFTLTDLRGHMDGGSFSGAVVLNNLDDPADRKIMVGGQVHDIDIERTTTRIFDEDKDPYKGIARGTFRLQSVLGEEMISSLQGDGKLLLVDSTLYKVPLFFGLSEYLSKLFKGFGYANQTDFETKWKIEDEKVHLHDGVLRGKVLSIALGGDVHFDKKLDMKLHVRPMDKGLIADLVQRLSWPVTKLLFEFKVTGSTDDPDWRPDNIPKELFGKS